MDTNATEHQDEGGQETLESSSQQATTKAQRRAQRRTERTSQATEPTAAPSDADSAAENPSGDATTGDSSAPRPSDTAQLEDDVDAIETQSEPAPTYTPPDTPGDIELPAEDIIGAARPLLGISPHLARGILIGEDRLTVDQARQKVAAVHDREVT